MLNDLHRSKQARDAALASLAYGGMGETFEQLDEALVTLGAMADGRGSAYDRP